MLQIRKLWPRDCSHPLYQEEKNVDLNLTSFLLVLLESWGMYVTLYQWTGVGPSMYIVSLSNIFQEKVSFFYARVPSSKLSDCQCNLDIILWPPVAQELPYLQQWSCHDFRKYSFDQWVTTCKFFKVLFHYILGRNFYKAKKKIKHIERFSVDRSKSEEMSDACWEGPLRSLGTESS